MTIRCAIIGGTGVYDPSMLVNLTEHRLTTPYGDVAVQVGEMEGEKVAFMARHGLGHSVPPHMINYRANISALRQLGVERILSTSAVGSLNPDMKPGDCVVLDQFLDFTKSRAVSFFDGGEKGVFHVDVTEPYCPELRGLLLQTACRLQMRLHPRATYVCVEGPRYETAAEIKAFRFLGGDLVGMTNVPEVVLAREAGICYASVAIVTNFAAGISADALTHEEVVACMSANVSKVRELFRRTLLAMPQEHGCNCQALGHWR